MRLEIRHEHDHVPDGHWDPAHPWRKVTHAHGPVLTYGQGDALDEIGRVRYFGDDTLVVHAG